MSDLKGRVALITGVSRRNAIGFGIAKRLAGMDADLLLHSFAPYDRTFSSISEVPAPDSIAGELRQHGIRAEHIEADFIESHSPARVMRKAVEKLGHVDILVVNHTHDTLKTLDELTPEEIDRHLAVNVRATLLLIQE
ncbi:MAG: SDR family NAD(P)-dependent oxidoreductase, partial [Bacteroidota bacterium]